MFIRAVTRSVRRWFPERGCILEHQILRFAGMILRDRCSTSYDLASLFRSKRSTLDRWSGKIAKRNGTRPSALHSTFHFWRKSRWIASFFDVVNFKKWGSLAELLRFWRCQVQKMRKSRWIAAFLMLSSSKAGEVSQNSFVFKLADRQIDRETTTTATTSTTTLHYYHYYNYKCKYITLHDNNTYTTLHKLHYNYYDSNYYYLYLYYYYYCCCYYYSITTTTTTSTTTTTTTTSTTTTTTTTTTTATTTTTTTAAATTTTTTTAATTIAGALRYTTTH